MDKAAIHALAALYSSPTNDTPENVMMRCPFAPVRHKNGTDNHPSFSVKIAPDEPSVSRCFSCGWAGPVRLAFEEAHELTSLYAVCVEHIEATDRGGLEGALAGLRRTRAESGMPSMMGVTTATTIERYVASCMRFVPHYLIQRGVVRADVEKWRLGFDHETMRAIFPIWDERGALVGCDRRAISDDVHPKYHAWPTGFKKKHYFYGEHLIDPTRERVYLVEGPMDTVFAGRLLPNVLGMLGAHTGVGPERLAKLLRWAKRVTFVFDGDEPGEEAVEGYIDDWDEEHPGLRQKLRQHFVCDVAELPHGEDPASLIVANPGAFLAAVTITKYLGIRS
jgi:hypothetical protein